MRNKSQKSRNYEVLRRIQVLVLTIVLFTMNLMPIKVQAATTIQNVESIDFTNFSNWRSGCYNWTDGKYMENAYRLCLKDYVTFSGTKYKVHVTEGVYHILIRELDSNKNFLRTSNLSNGQEYIPGSGAKYLGISIYKSDWETCMSYATYQSKFAKGFVAELVRVQDSSSNVSNSNSSTGTTDTILSDDIISDNITSSGSAVADDTSEYYAIDTLNLNDFDNWRSGYYNYTNGKYDASMTTRVCLNKYATFSNSSYKISISNADYHVLIREMDSDMKFVKSYNLADGATYTPSSNAKYLGISLYKVWEKNVTYESLKKLFANGFTVCIESDVQVEEQDDIISIPDNTLGNSSVNVTLSAKDAVSAIMEDMLVNGDTSKRDVSSYNLTYTTFYNEVVPEFKENHYIEYASAYNLYPNATMKGQYIQNVWFENMDTNYLARVEKVRASVQEYLDSMDGRMNDLEKILLAHEYVINHAYYKDDNTISHCAGGPLGNGYGVCDGYSKAMIVLLKQVGIECDEVSSSTMDHGWTYVKLDGAWYHIDATWDDTQKGSNEQYTHRFLIRNDDEFNTIYAARNHYGWKTYNTSEASTSTKYKDWYVHDVAGTMYYYNDMWYYWDMSSNSILCSDINGTVTKTIVDGTAKGKIQLKGINGNKLIYMIGTTQYSRSI